MSPASSDSAGNYVEQDMNALKSWINELNASTEEEEEELKALDLIEADLENSKKNWERDLNSWIELLHQGEKAKILEKRTKEQSMATFMDSLSSLEGEVKRLEATETEADQQLNNLRETLKAMESDAQKISSYGDTVVEKEQHFIQLRAKKHFYYMVARINWEKPKKPGICRKKSVLESEFNFRI